MHIYHSLTQLVGHTPLLSIDRYCAAQQLRSTVLVKLECCNPAGSAKDRVAWQMIQEAEASGALIPGGTIIEPTSGNTGIGLAAMGIARGYHVILTMPDSMSTERRALLMAYGAQLVLTPGAEGMSGAVKKAEALAREIPNSWMAGQFDNPANPRTHYLTTGPEIWQDTDGHVDLFVAGVGTGGTLSGSAAYLKEQNPALQAIAVEPASSPLLSEGHAGPHGLQGIGANFVPKNLNRAIIDRIFPVTNDEAYQTARTLAATEGVLCGISSGAALHAATELARQPENTGKTIVVVLPDTGERYLSTPLFSK